MDKFQSNEMLKKNIYDELSKSNFDWSSMRKIMGDIGADKLVDAVDIDEVMQLPNSERFFSVLLQGKNNKKISSKIAKDEKYQRYFLDKLQNNYSIVASIDSKDVKEIVRNIDSSGNNPKNFKLFLSCIDKSTQDELLRENLSDEVILSLARSADKTSLQYFINNNPKALTMYKDIGIEKMIDMGINFPKDIIRQPEFLDSLKGKDMVQMRRNINRLYRNNYSPEIQKKVEEYRRSIIKDYDPEKKIFKSYANINSREDLEKIDIKDENFILDGYVNYKMHEKIDNLEEYQKYLKEVTKQKMSEVVVDSLFNDTKNDVDINIEEMFRYSSKVRQDVLYPEDRELYSKIQNIDELDTNEILDMYNRFGENGLTSKLYNDISVLRKDSYEKIAKSIYNVDKNIKDYSSEDSQKREAEIYKLKGDPFFMLVRRLNTPYRGETSRDQSSYSLISGNNMHTFEEERQENDEGFLYGYDDLAPDSIVNVYERDSYTTQNEENITTRVNRIMTPQEIADSQGYSEINIKNKKNKEWDGKSPKDEYKEMTPKYLVAMGKITDRQIAESKRLGVPIVSIDRERYKENITQNIEAREYDREIN